MIFSECKNGHTIICYYEAGQEPIGVYERIVCDECGAVSFVQRISFDGHTYDEAEFWQMEGAAKIPWPTM